jgi:hypothetical protein
MDIKVDLDGCDQVVWNAERYKRERDTHIQNKVEADWNSIRERWCCAVKNSGGGGGGDEEGTAVQYSRNGIMRHSSWPLFSGTIQFSLPFPPMSCFMSHPTLYMSLHWSLFFSILYSAIRRAANCNSTPSHHHHHHHYLSRFAIAHHSQTTSRITASTVY